MVTALIESEAADVADATTWVNFAGNVGSGVAGIAGRPLTGTGIKLLAEGINAAILYFFSDDVMVGSGPITMFWAATPLTNPDGTSTERPLQLANRHTIRLCQRSGSTSAGMALTEPVKHVSGNEGVTPKFGECFQSVKLDLTISRATVPTDEPRRDVSSARRFCQHSEYWPASFNAIASASVVSLGTILSAQNESDAYDFALKRSVQPRLECPDAFSDHCDVVSTTDFPSDGGSHEHRRN